MDGPAHREMRALVAHAFSRRAVERMRPAVTEVCSGLLTELVAAGPPADLVGQFATPMSLAVIGEVLGLSVTAEEHEAIRVWTRSKLSQAVTDQDAVRTSGLHLFHYFQAQIAAQRERPSGGLTAQLVAACDEQQLTEMELLQLLMMLFAAGHETTVEAVTRAVLQLLRGPAQLDRLRQRPELLEIAVEELLRRQFGPTVGVDRGRVAAEDVTLGSVAIRQGEAVMVSLDAANHDARVFPDPKRLDLGRQPNPHLSFGDGPHFCLGAALARLELEVALRSLIWGLPALAEVDPPPAAEPAHPPLGSIRQLMVRW
jgi:nocardicin N-oxygenase